MRTERLFLENENIISTRSDALIRKVLYEINQEFTCRLVLAGILALMPAAALVRMAQNEHLHNERYGGCDNRRLNRCAAWIYGKVIATLLKKYR
jgi:hypothetical protein